MSCSNVKISPSNRKAAIEELIRGRDLANRLGAVLQEKSSVHDEQTSIVKEVMGVFSRAIVALECRNDEENCRGYRKIQSTQRGGYRRRSHPYSSIMTNAKSVDDGHLWRKYGQKEIYSSKFPRSYFRCTHKFDQGCRATRQVQRSEEDPSLFVITYFGEHTCRDPIQISSSRLQEDGCIIDFAAGCKQSVPLSYLKRACSEEVVSNNTSTPGSGSSTSEYFEFPELRTLKGSADQLVEEFAGANENGDITSGLMQPCDEDLRWDHFMTDSLEFSDLFSFEHDELFRD